MRRYACRNLRNHLVGGRIQNLDRTESRLSKVERLAIVTELSVARCLVEIQGANQTPRGDVDEGETEVTRFLHRDVRELTVGADRDSMWLRHRHVGSHGLRRGIDEGDTVLAVDRDHQQPVIWRESHAVRRLADVDRLDDFVGGRIDNVNRRRAVAAYVDSATVLRYRHAVRPGGDWNGRDDLAGVGIDHAHRVVFEIPDVGLWTCGENGRCDQSC